MATDCIQYGDQLSLLTAPGLVGMGKSQKNFCWEEKLQEKTN